VSEPDRSDVPEAETARGRFAHLPAPVRREDLRTSQDVVPVHEPVAEADSERNWLLRTTGLFL
jgi:hypothetical protein